MSKVIHVTPTVRFSIDARAVSIETAHVGVAGKTLGETQWAFLGHYPSIKQAALALLNRHRSVLDDRSLKSLGCLVTAIQEAEAKIVAAIERAAVGAAT